MQFHLFLKLPLYVIDWLKYVNAPAHERNSPLTLPYEATAYGRQIYYEAVPNPDMEWHSNKCYSQRCFNANPFETDRQYLDGLPDHSIKHYAHTILRQNPGMTHDELLEHVRTPHGRAVAVVQDMLKTGNMGDASQYVAINLPPAHWGRNGRWIMCNDDMTLHAIDAGICIDAIVNRFWSCCDKFVTEYLANPDQHEGDNNRQSALLSFCESYSIRPGLWDSFERQYKRVMKRKAG